jgi:hypothetical protein
MMDRTSSAISVRALASAAFALAVLLAAGVLILGLGGGEPAVAQTGCATGRFAYDAAEQRRQRAFEARLGSGADLPPSGFHASAQDMTATVHAASHAYVVVFYRPGMDTTALRALATDAQALQIPLVAVPREQRAALVAITRSVQFTCDAPRVDAVRGFAAGYYADLAQ